MEWQPFLLSLVCLTIFVASTVGLTFLSVQSTATIISTEAKFDYVVIIMMENHPLNYSVDPTGIIGNPSAPFINQLAKNYSLSTNYQALSSGSLPNYLGITNANITSVGSNCDTPSASCSTSAVNIVDRIEASGRTWKAYMEDYTGGCNGIGSAGYAAFHDPFVFYSDITNNSTRCTRIVSANPGHTGLPDNQLISDLNSTTTASNYMWVTPNECDNMHDNNIANCSPSLVANGDTYLSTLVPEILQSKIFRTQRAALFITWDEPTSCLCPMPAIWIGPPVKHNYVSKTLYNHYSVLATLENIWKLQPLTVNDKGASIMTEFFS